MGYLKILCVIFNSLLQLIIFKNNKLFPRIIFGATRSKIQLFWGGFDFVSQQLAIILISCLYKGQLLKREYQYEDYRGKNLTVELFTMEDV